MMYYIWICLLLVVSYSEADLQGSPCPNVFSYEGSESEHDRWFGTVLLSTDESLVGVRLTINLDRPSQLLVSWLGEVNTMDNLEYTIFSQNQKLHPGLAMSTRFMVKFNSTLRSPQVRKIFLNGRQICPPDPNALNNGRNEDLSIRNQETTERQTRRPDPDFQEDSRPKYETSIVKSTKTPYHNDDGYEINHPTRQNSNSFQENNVFHSTTERFYNNENKRNDNNDFNEYEGKISTTEWFGNVQNSRHRTNYNNQGSKNFDQYSTTERYEDSRSVINHNQRPNTNSYINDNEEINNNNKYVTTEKSNNGEETSGQNPKQSRIQQNNQIYNVTNTRTTTEPPSSNNRRVTSSVHSSDHKSNINSPDLHLSTNFHIDSGQSNEYPTMLKKNETTLSKNSISNGKRSQAKYDGDLDTAASNGECGKVEVQAEPLITHGQNTAHGQWPWHIALYKIEEINLSYICGGSLISPTAVITAAHCVTKAPRGRPLEPEVLVVYIGKYHLRQFSDDEGVQNKQVREVFVYPQYNHTNYHDDIAILILTSPVEYTKYVRPVCLWDSDDTELNTVEGKEGTVVGWGYDENNKVTEELKMARMPVVSQQTCIYSYPDFFSQFTSNKTYCAGFRKGTSVCNGDSGGGMVFSKESSWYLRGLVSLTVSKQGLRVCDVSHYVVFTDVAKYLDWIKQHINY